jgi:hypothetical protein
LNFICGFSSLLRQELYGRLNEKQGEYVHLINDCAHQVLRLLAICSTWLCPNGGELILPLENIDPADLLTAVTAQAHNRSIALITGLPP